MVNAECRKKQICFLETAVQIEVQEHWINFVEGEVIMSHEFILSVVICMVSQSSCLAQTATGGGQNPADPFGFSGRSAPQVPPGNPSPPSPATPPVAAATPSPASAIDAVTRRESMVRTCLLLGLDPNSVLSPATQIVPGPANQTLRVVDVLDDRQNLEFRRERARKLARRLLEIAANPAAIATLANPVATPMQKVGAGAQLVGQLFARSGAESASLNDPEHDELVQAKDLLLTGDEKQRAEFAEDLGEALQVEKLVAERRAAIDRLKSRQAKIVEIEEVRLEEYRSILHREQLERELRKMPE